MPIIWLIVHILHPYHIPSSGIERASQRVKTLEKTEEAIKNEESRDIGNIGYTRHRTKINKTKKKERNKITAQYRRPNNIRNTDSIKTGREPSCPRRVSSSPASKETPVYLHLETHMFYLCSC